MREDEDRSSLDLMRSVSHVVYHYMPPLYSRYFDLRPVIMSAIHQFGDNELVINYNDAVIYGKDLGLYENRTAWLNDACIHYRLTRLQQKYDPTSKSELFFDPAVVSFLMHQVEDEDEMRDFSRGYNHFESTKRIFVPVNDNMGSSHWQTPGLGSHWSLLVLNVSSEPPISLHFDSVTGSNQKTAQAVATKLYQALDTARQSARRDLENNVVQECITPQQKNGFDCGVHVLANAEALSVEAINGLAGQNDIERRLANRDPFFAESLRAQIAHDIRLQASAS
jgi:sentrin-specific protease 8